MYLTLREKRIKVLIYVHILFLTVLFVLIAYQNNLKFPIHDFLDGYVPLIKYVGENKFSLTGTDLDRFLYGINSGLLGFPNLSPELMWFRVTSNTTLALLFSEIFIRYIGFIGFLSLVKIIPETSINLKVTFAAVFAFLPIYPSIIYTVMIQPLFASLILKIVQSRVKMKDSISALFIGIVAIPTFSYIFFLSILIISIAMLLRYVQFSRKSFFAILVFTMAHCLTFLPTYQTLFQNKIYHRQEFKIVNEIDFISKLEMYLRIVLFGDYHFNTNFFLFIPLVIVGFFVSRKLEIDKSLLRYQKTALLLTIIFFIIFIVSTEWYNVLIKIIPFNQNLQYINSTFPLLFVLNSYLSSAIISRRISKTSLKKLILIPPIILSISSFYLFPWYDRHPIKGFLSITNSSTINDYYSYEIFNNNQMLTTTNNKLMSYGIDPMIALYNGQYIADGYASLYELNYKKKFRLVIQSNLESNIFYKDYFDNWGSRLYLFGQADSLDFCAARALNVKYIVSNQLIDINSLRLIQNKGELYQYEIICSS